MFMDDSIMCENVVGWMIGHVIYGSECDAVSIKKFLESACDCLITRPQNRCWFKCLSDGNILPVMMGWLKSTPIACFTWVSK